MEFGSLVTVIMPCFNGESFIEEAIESVLMQTYRNLELIIVNDGSTDGSEDIVKKHLENDRVKYIKHKENKGIPFARNTGLASAKGDYIAFLDQDDIWMPEKITYQMEIISEGGNEDVGMVFSDVLYRRNGEEFERAWPREKIPGNINVLPRRRALSFLYMNNFIPMITVLVRRECMKRVGRFDEKILGGADDHDIFIRIAGISRILYIDRALAVHRIHENNYSDLIRFLGDEMTIAEKAPSLFPELGQHRGLKKEAIYGSMESVCAKAGDFHQAARWMRRAIQERPSRPKYWFKFVSDFAGICFGNEAYQALNALGKHCYSRLISQV